MSGHPLVGLVSSGRSGRRPWTQAGTAAMAGHVFYELAAGAAMPLASRVGVARVAVLYAAGSLAVIHEARRQPPSRDIAFAVLDAMFLSAVINHFSSWPRTSIAGLPWLTECEGLSGRLMPAYNAILYFTGIAAVAGLVENRRGAAWAALVPPVLVPVLRDQTPREYRRLCEQARDHPRWWNRRLQPQWAAP